MLLRDTTRIALRSIRANLSRSLLTMLGIIIGVGSVTLMTSIGASVEGLILGQVSSLGAKSVIIVPGRDEGGPSRPAFDALSLEDVEAVERLTTVQTVAPIMNVTATSVYGREEANPEVIGTVRNYFKNQSIEIERGRGFDASDERGARFVAVLAPDTVEDLFGDLDPLGKRMKINDRTFTVIGVTKALGTQFFQNADRRIYIPLATAKDMTGVNYVSFVTLTATDSIELAMADITSLLRQRHRIHNPDEDPAKDDFFVRSAAQALDILGTVSLSLTLFLSAIAGISLVVGGIGIMNIMLVAVTERTREIGLRKAVGARRRDILMQFLIEAIFLTVIGGIIGMTAGLLFAFLGAIVAHQFLAGYTFAISVPATLLALFTAAATGLVFGIYPARRAASLNPIEALRYE